MKKLFLTLSIALSCGLLAHPAHALLIGVTGPNSIDVGNGGGAGTAPAIIGVPAFALDDNVTNTGMQGFNERQGVTTSMAYAIDGGTLSSGTLVNSHMIFLNTANTDPTGDGPGARHRRVVWEFSDTILGVMSSGDGFMEFASTSELGNPGTTYQAGPTFRARGLEGNSNNGDGPGDGYQIEGDNNRFLRVSMFVTEPGDWIRVVTASTVPEPGTILLLGSGLAGLGLWRWKKEKSA